MSSCNMWQKCMLMLDFGGLWGQKRGAKRLKTKEGKWRHGKIRTEIGPPHRTLAPGYQVYDPIYMVPYP